MGGGRKKAHAYRQAGRSRDDPVWGIMLIVITLALRVALVRGLHLIEQISRMIVS
jgi:hypothetical protein